MPLARVANTYFLCCDGCSLLRATRHVSGDSYIGQEVFVVGEERSLMLLNVNTQQELELAEEVAINQKLNKQDACCFGALLSFQVGIEIRMSICLGEASNAPT